MNPTVEEFLKKERVGVLSIVQPDGSSHSATMHFSYQDTPFQLFFMTGVKTKKVAHLMHGANAKASVVIGFSETKWQTLQLEGTVHIIFQDDEKIRGLTSHFLKFTRLAKYTNAAEIVLLSFIPTWWRYSDYTNFPPQTISSTD